MFSRRDLLKLILPMMLQEVLGIMIGTVDSMMVSSAGEAAISGVSLVAGLDALLCVAFSAMVTGGSVCISHALGSGDKKFSRECVKQLVYVATGVALVITVVVSIFRVPILDFLYGSAEADVLTSANSYMRIMALNFPLIAYNNSGFAIFRTMGDTVTGLKLSVLENVLNVIGDAIFIIGFDMGATGAALASLIARAANTVIITVMLRDKSKDLYIEKMLRYRPDMKIIRSILRIGVPNGIENSMFQFGTVVTRALVSTMGTASIAANSVASTLTSFLSYPCAAIDNATLIVIGRCCGAGEYKQAKKYSWKLLLLEYVCVWGMSILLLALSRPIIGVYGLSENSASITTKMLVLYCGVCCLTRPLAFYLTSVFRGAGESRFSMCVSSLSMWVIRVGLAYVLAPETVDVFGLSFPGAGMGIMGVWVALGADNVVRAVFFTCRYIKGKWLKQKI